MGVHPTAARGFGSAAETYERARPGYPPEAVSWLAERLGLRPGTTVVDLAAGTGKFTRELAGTGAAVVAVEPIDEMLARLEAALPGVDARAGHAERMPLPDASADAVTIAQAFHWFASDEALTEIARVLKPHGGLGLVWNTRDQEDELQRRFAELVEPLRVDEPPHAHGRWRPVLESSALFGPVEERRFRTEQLLDADGLADRAASISFVAAAPQERRAEVVERVRALAGDRVVRFPYVTAAYVSRRRG